MQYNLANYRQKKRSAYDVATIYLESFILIIVKNERGDNTP